MLVCFVPFRLIYHEIFCFSKFIFDANGNINGNVNIEAKLFSDKMLQDEVRRGCFGLLVTLNRDLCGRCIGIGMVNVKVQAVMFVVVAMLMFNTCICGHYCGRENNTNEMLVA